MPHSSRRGRGVRKPKSSQSGLLLVHIPPCHAMPCHAMPCHAMPCHAMPCHAMPCHAMPCHAMPCHAMPCHAIPCHTVPCHAMPCHAMPCHILSYTILSSRDCSHTSCCVIKRCFWESPGPGSRDLSGTTGSAVWNLDEICTVPPPLPVYGSCFPWREAEFLTM